MSRPNDSTRRADALGGQQHVDPSARAQVEYALAFVQVSDGNWVAASERSEDGGVGELVLFEGAVQRCADAVGRCAAGSSLVEDGDR